MFERFTDRARRIMALANRQAQRFNHEYIGTEHILLGIVEEGHGAAADVLKSLGVDLPTVQFEVEKLVRSGPDMVAAGKLPQTPRAKKVIEYAIEEARSLGHDYVGSEHLLLGLLRTCEGVAAKVLTDLGVKREAARDEVLRLEGPDGESDDAEPDGAERGDDEDAKERTKQLIRAAIDAGATDIHFDGTRDGRGRMRFRVDGALYETAPAGSEIGKPGEGLLEKVVRRIKYMANLDTEQQSLPQVGRVMLKVDGKEYDLRVSTVPAQYGERLVVRVLDRQQVRLTLDDFGLDDADLARIRDFCRLPSGLVVANGPAGSGKTTLLYAMLLEANSLDKCVVTAEDPVEYTFDDIAQIQTNPSAGLTYARVVRSILRQDPDVIMVGEILDLETADLLIQCAMTGHLVFTTLHADTSPGAIQRLLDIGVEPYLINAGLAGVISQRLVRKLCSECKQPIEPPEHSMPPEAVEFLSKRSDATFCRPVGCDECQSTGYRGRAAIHEILIMDDAIRKAVADTADISAVRRAAIEAGMKTMLRSGLEKATQGVTSIEEVLRVVPHGPTV